MRRLIPLIVLICFLITGCNKSPEEEIGYGKINEGVYTNGYFDMSIQFPKDWVSQSQEAIKEITKTGQDLIAGDNENLKATIKTAEKQTLNLFIVMQYEIGSPVTFNPSISCIAEKVGHMPGVKSGSDYYYHAKKIMESGQMNFEFPREIYTEEISNVSFDILPVMLNMGHMKIHQKYYAAMIKDYILLLVLTYSSGAEEESLNDILKTLNFRR